MNCIHGFATNRNQHKSLFSTFATLKVHLFALHITISRIFSFVETKTKKKTMIPPVYIWNWRQRRQICNSKLTGAITLYASYVLLRVNSAHLRDCVAHKLWNIISLYDRTTFANRTASNDWLKWTDTITTKHEKTCGREIYVSFALCSLFWCAIGVPKRLFVCYARVHFASALSLPTSRVHQSQVLRRRHSLRFLCYSISIASRVCVYMFVSTTTARTRVIATGCVCSVRICVCVCVCLFCKDGLCSPFLLAFLRTLVGVRLLTTFIHCT